MCSFQFAWFSVRTFMVAENWCLTLPCRSGQTYRRQVTQLSLLPLPLWMAVGFVFHSNFVLRKCLAHAMFLYAIPINYTSFSSETLVCLMLRSAVHDCDTILLLSNSLQPSLRHWMQQKLMMWTIYPNYVPRMSYHWVVLSCWRSIHIQPFILLWGYFGLVKTISPGLRSFPLCGERKRSCVGLVECSPECKVVNYHLQVY